MISQPTIVDVAKAAGVAKSTVSGVLNNSKKLSVTQKTRDRILAAAHELNYVPAAYARALTSRRTYQIGFLLYARVTMNLANGYFGACMCGAHDACEELGYRLMVNSFHIETLGEFLTPSNIRGRSVDGVIIAGSVETCVLEAIEGTGIPVVLIGEPCDRTLEKNLVIVRQNNKGEFYRLLEYARSLGHRRLGLPEARTEVWQKFEGVTERFNRENSADMVLQQFVAGHDDIYENMFERGYQNASDWVGLPRESRPTLIFSSDHWCYSFLHGLKELGVSCPEEVSVVSSFDPPHCRWTNPALTAFHYEPGKYGKLAANILVEMLDDGLTLAEAQNKALAAYNVCGLIVRESTGPAPRWD